MATSVRVSRTACGGTQTWSLSFRTRPEAANAREIHGKPVRALALDDRIGIMTAWQLFTEVERDAAMNRCSAPSRCNRIPLLSTFAAIRNHVDRSKRAISERLSHIPHLALDFC
jgi:hypothetical protein